MIQKLFKNNKGYTLLFAVLVSSLVLAVGISILNISKKEFLLASSARESTAAFYAADSGLECGVYFIDKRLKPTEYNQGIPCAQHFASQPAAITLVTSGTDETYTFDVNLNGSSCAVVKVTKKVIPAVAPETTDGYSVGVESRGYNIGWSAADNRCNVPSPRKVERALYYNYSY